MKTSETSLNSIFAAIEEPLSKVQGEIFKNLSTSNELISQVVKYFFSSSGKLLRPALCLLGANFGKPDWKQAVKLAATWEILHSASLIHDDIIDGSILRRNMPTVPMKWGSQISVLVGDYMQSCAIRSVHSTENEKIISLFINTGSIVCDGEIMEVKENNNFDLTEDQYFSIIEKKTAALLAACIKSGAILGKLKPEECASLSNYGLYFGIAFQIIDDCLDFSGDGEKFGKALGADVESGVLTLPLIRLLNLVPSNKKSEVFKAFKAYGAEEKLEYLIRLMEEYDTINYAIDKAGEYIDKARLELSTFSDSPSKEALLELLNFALIRKR
jgi:octaprenyl-diphosphate synthase